MRRLLLGFSVLALLGVAACQPAAPPASETAATEAARSALPRIEPVASRGKRIELVNNARRGDVVRLEFAPIEDREAFREAVGARGLKAGAERRVMVGSACVYDTRAVMSDGSVLRQFRVDVCSNSRIFLLDWPAEGEPPTMSGPQPSPPAMSEPPMDAAEAPAAAASAPDMDRGLPTCPGDPRCKKPE